MVHARSSNVVAGTFIGHIAGPNFCIKQDEDPGKMGRIIIVPSNYNYKTFNLLTYLT